MNELLKNIYRHDTALFELCRTIYEHPELGYCEHQAVQAQQKFYTELGANFTANYAGVETAFRAESGSGKVAVAFLAEYDALPNLGHGCGHNLIATAAAAAFTGLAELQKNGDLPGKIVVIGAPAEETFGGKIDVLKNGGFDDIDCVFAVHPLRCNAVDNGSYAVSRFDVAFDGRAAHAASKPESGINALNAMQLLFHAIDCYRQQLPSDSRIHGIITKGGDAPNIIPEHTEAFFYVRSLSDPALAKLSKMLQNMVKGAALMTGCKGTCQLRANSYSSGKLNPTLLEAAKKAMTALDLTPQPISEHISTDYADVSKKVPGVQIFFEVDAFEDEPALHTQEFYRAAGTTYAFEQSLRSGAAVAAVAERYLRDAKFRKQVK